jgi:predicted transcriptional regulator
MNTLALSQHDMKRLERLAKEAGRTPRALFRFVLRDGFEETERTIKAVRERMAAGTKLEHAAAMKRLDSLLAGHANSRKAA